MSDQKPTWPPGSEPQKTNRDLQRETDEAHRLERTRQQQAERESEQIDRGTNRNG